MKPVIKRKTSKNQNIVLVGGEFGVCVGVGVGLACYKIWRMRDYWRVSFVPDAGDDIMSEREQECAWECHQFPQFLCQKGCLERTTPS